MQNECPMKHILNDGSNKWHIYLEMYTWESSTYSWKIGNEMQELKTVRTDHANAAGPEAGKVPFKKANDQDFIHLLE